MESTDGTSGPSPTPPRPKPRLSPGAVGGIVAVVLAVIVVLSLMFAGLIPGIHPFKTSSSPSTPTYDVNFTESGLPSATSWSVTLDGATTPSTASTISFSEPNGVYAYTVGTVTGYESRPVSGSVTVSGVAQVIAVAFEPTLESTLSSSASTTQVGAAVVLTIGLSGGFSPETWTLTENGSSANLSGVTSDHYTFAPAHPGSYTFYLNATDGVDATARASTTVTVRPALEAELSASPPTTQVGGTSTLTLAFSGGVAPVAWTLAENGSSANLTGASGGHFTFRPAEAATYTFYLNATDHAGSVSDVTATVTVEPALVATLSASPTSVPVGKTSTVTLGFSGGVSPISWTLTENGSAANLSGASNGQYLFGPVAAGTYTFYLNATDAVGSVANATTEVSVTPGLLSTLSASLATTQMGVNSTLTVGFVGGVPPSFWTLEVNGSVANLTAVGDQYTFVPPAPGTYTFYLNATDAGGNWSNVTTTVTVVPALAVTLSPSSTLISTSKTLTLTLGFSGGVLPVQWTLEENGSSANLSGVELDAYVFAPTGAGTYTFYLNATDTVGSVSQTNTTVKVVPGLRASLTANPALTEVGEPSTLTIAFLGPVRAAAWTLEENGSSSNLSGVTDDQYTFVPTGPGTYTFYLNATDAGGNTSNATATVTVEPPLGATLTASPSSTTIGTPSTLTLGFSGGVAPIAWTLEENGSNANLSGVSDARYLFLPTAPGTYTFYLNATDYVGSIASATATVSVSASVPYAVTFTETGLSTATPWTVTLGGVSDTSTGSSLSIDLPNGSYDFTAGASGYTGSPGFGPLIVAGSPVGQSVRFTRAVSVGDYTLSFTQTGLNNSTAWALEVTENLSGTLYGAAQGGEGSTIEFAVPNGTYAWVAENETNYTVVPGGGSITIDGHDEAQSIVYEPSYDVNFTATGLPYGTIWSVEIGGMMQNLSSYDNASFALPNGTYNFRANSTGFSADPDSGKITVNGQSVNETIVFTQGYTYSVSFSETGLAFGDFWTVYLDGQVQFGLAGISGDITFAEANGTYGFTAYPADGYIVSPAFGPVVVAGAAVSLTLTFSVPTTFPVTFTESGLPAGTYWYVNLNDSEEYSDTTTVEFNETNGVYNFAIGAEVEAYSISPAAGSIAVSGGAAGQAVTFTQEATYPLTVSETGLPSNAPWELEVGGLDGGGSFFNESTGTTAVVEVPDGYYSFEVDAIASPGYVGSPSFGSVEVAGQGVITSVTFVYAPSDHLVTFLLLNDFGGVLSEELGAVPNGSAWTVTIDGVTQTTIGEAVTFLVPNGTYAYSITPPVGYTSWPSSGVVTVNSTASSPSFLGAAYIELDFHASSGGVPISGLASDAAPWLTALRVSPAQFWR